MLSFLYGMAVLAGFVLGDVCRHRQTMCQKLLVGLMISVFVVISPIAQSWMLNFRFYADPINPYVYAHTSTDVYKMADAVHKAADAWREGNDVEIHVIAPEDDYWPLPWYLRSEPNVGYWNEVTGSVCKAPIILLNAELEQSLLETLYSVPGPGKRHLYVPLFDEALYLRPHIQWLGYVRSDLWEQLNTGKRAAEPPKSEDENFMRSQLQKETIENLLKFSHRAMHANFEIYIQDTRGTYAGRAARAAFNEVDRLEGLLSRHVDNSDISRINALGSGEDAIVNEDTLRCLQVARDAWELTDGVFDVTLGDVISAWKSGLNSSIYCRMKRPPIPKSLISLAYRSTVSSSL
jgi:hypothetical protein